MRRLRSASAALLLLLTTSSCEDVVGLLWRGGSLNFSYSGARSGSFDADGEYGDAGPSWAAGGVHQYTMTIRARFHDSTLEFLVLDNHMGPYQLGTDLHPLAAHGVFVTTTGGVERAYLVRSGTLWIDFIGGSRIRGRFSGSAQAENGDVIVLSSGDFDVPDILPDTDYYD
jgi:hypothetical protein